MRHLTALSILLPFAGLIASADDDVDTPITLTPDATVERVMAAMDVITAKHVEPPARADMARQFAKSISRGNSLPTLPGDASADEEINAFLLRVCQLEPIAGNLNVDAIDPAIYAMLRSVPGVRIEQLEEQKVNQQLAENRYVGIGIRLQMEQDGTPSMPKVFPGGPAADAGAKDGDRIDAIDGESTKGKGPREIVSLLRGPSGSHVTVTLRQPGEDDPRVYTLTRGVVPIASIEPPRFSEDKSLALISITRVASSTPRELRIVESELPETVTTVVLEFRGQDSHDVHLGKLLANALLDGGPIGIVKERERMQTVIAERGRLFRNHKLAILVSRGTYGTLEWIAAALQDRDVATVIGKPTAGRAFIAESVTLGDRFSIRLPTGILRRADGRSLTGTGPVSEDVLEMTEELAVALANSRRDRAASRQKVTRPGNRVAREPTNCVVPDILLGDDTRVVVISPDSLRESLRTASTDKETE